MPLTIKEVCDALRVSRWTAGRLIKSGELKAIKTGDAHSAAVRIDDESYADFIERHTVPASTEQRTKP